MPKGCRALAPDGVRSTSSLGLSANRAQQLAGTRSGSPRRASGIHPSTVRHSAQARGRMAPATLSLLREGLEPLVVPNDCSAMCLRRGHCYPRRPTRVLEPAVGLGDVPCQRVSGRSLPREGSPTPFVNARFLVSVLPIVSRIEVESPRRSGSRCCRRRCYPSFATRPANPLRANASFVPLKHVAL